MAYVEGVERTQSTLFPQSLDEYITVENPVRFVDAFVAGLDLDALGFERAVPAEELQTKPIEIGRCRSHSEAKS